MIEDASGTDGGYGNAIIYADYSHALVGALFSPRCLDSSLHAGGADILAVSLALSGPGRYDSAVPLTPPREMGELNSACRIQVPTTGKAATRVSLVSLLHTE